MAKVIAFPGVGATARRDHIRRLRRRKRAHHDPVLNVQIIRDWFVRADNPPLVYVCDEALVGILKLRRQLAGLKEGE